MHRPADYDSPMGDDVRYESDLEWLEDQLDEEEEEEDWDEDEDEDEWDDWEDEEWEEV